MEQALKDARTEIDALRKMVQTTQQRGETIAELHGRMVKLIFDEAGLVMGADAGLWFMLGMLEGMMSREGA